MDENLDVIAKKREPIDLKPVDWGHSRNKLIWRHKVNLIGEKVVDPLIHSCDKCRLPILIYGRMIPCKHVFCLNCARFMGKKCMRCDDPVLRVEQSALGTVFICTWGGSSKHDLEGCRRTYLSQRDLQAHVNHRHLSRQKQSKHNTQPVAPPAQPDFTQAMQQMQMPPQGVAPPVPQQLSQPHGQQYPPQDMYMHHQQAPQQHPGHQAPAPQQHPGHGVQPSTHPHAGQGAPQPGTQPDFRPGGSALSGGRTNLITVQIQDEGGFSQPPPGYPVVSYASHPPPHPGQHHYPPPSVSHGQPPMQPSYSNPAYSVPPPMNMPQQQAIQRAPQPSGHNMGPPQRYPSPHPFEDSPRFASPGSQHSPRAHWPNTTGPPPSRGQPAYYHN